MISTLNENFINTWALPRELSEQIDNAKDEQTRSFAEALKSRYVGPVDIQILSPDAEIIVRHAEAELPDKNRAQAYLTLLADGLAGRSALKLGDPT